MKIGLFICDVYQRFAKDVIQISTQYAREHDITLDIFGSFPTSENNFLYAAGEKSIIYLPNLKDFDGLIIAGDTMMHHGTRVELLEHLRKNAICPVVSIRCEEEQYYNVLSHDEDSMYTMTRHFIEKHQLSDICFVTGRMTMIDAKRRLAGYRRAMEEAELEVTKDMIYYGDYWRGHEAQMIDFFYSSRGHLPEAIICSNDYMALPLCDELKRRGFKVPEDVKISGYDDLDDSPMHIPPLTSVNVPFDLMGKNAIEMAYLLAKGESVPRIKWIHSNNCFRDSCGCKAQDVDTNKEAYLAEYTKLKRIAKECINMGADFESALSEGDCFEWVRRYLVNTPVETCFICLKKQESFYQSEEILDTSDESERLASTDTERQIRLCYYVDADKMAKCEDIFFNESDLLPEPYVHMLDERTNIFLPIHCKNEVYGYFIFQLKYSFDAELSEKFEFLSMYTGNALKRLYIHQNLYSMRDIVYLYLRDPLTEVYNRRGFDQNFLELFNRAKKERFRIAIVSIDMDGLKYINDHFGHQVGDNAIIAVSKALSDSLLENEFCARMGGDEFEAVLILNSKKRIDDFSNSFLANIKRVNEQITEEYVVDASFGVCTIDEQAAPSEYIRKADRLMYENKNGKTKRQGMR